MGDDSDEEGAWAFDLILFLLVLIGVWHAHHKAKRDEEF